MYQSSPMNGGDGPYSYSKNSAKQRNAASAVMGAIKEALIDNLDIEKLLSSSTTFVISDLGCSVGPNTFFAMQTLIEAVEQKCHQQGQATEKLEFQVLFNDQTTNDFNTLFASLPNPRNYFAAGVPGYFHGRLFPSSSIHIAYSSYALHWMSKVPEELLVKESPAWNGGRIHYTGAPDAVVKAFADQFERDMEVFLKARGEEIVEGGMMVIGMPGVTEGFAGQGIGAIAPFFESILMDMVKEGLLDKDKLDLYNFPFVDPGMKDMRRVIEKNGCFEILKMELADIKTGNEDGEADPASSLIQLRAALEGSLASHFGTEIAAQVFVRAMEQKIKFIKFMHLFESPPHFWTVLKRKCY